MSRSQSFYSFFDTGPLSKRQPSRWHPMCLCIYIYRGRRQRGQAQWQWGGRFKREEQEEEEEGEDTPDVGDSKIAILIVQ